VDVDFHWANSRLSLRTKSIFTLRTVAVQYGLRVAPVKRKILGYP
jgi:hypothetical protein